MEEQTILALAGAGVVGVLGFMLLGGNGGSGNSARVRQMTGVESVGGSLKKRLKVEDQGSRRKEIEQTLGKIEERQKQKQKKAKSIESKLIQANWTMQAKKFHTISFIIAAVMVAVLFVVGAPPMLIAGGAFVSGFGLPRFFLNGAIKRRQKKFVAHFADGMDIIVRGVRTGLPLGDCLKIIAHESPDPLGMEFRRVVEGESVGIPIEVCLEQLYERMPTSEVNFFATVLNIQKTTGGNLGESLANLSNVLRSRKILREKIKSLSAEAKMSAIIIGALPIVVMVLVWMMSPEYLMPLFNTDRGQKNLMIAAGMMFTGIFVMRKMINFKF